ncbi:MAG: hypothetical protein N2044_05375 [Cyclobacteriaceae bacterium]|nr:hypothetical protein [Cyclobacteriaceae bacterium]MCX7637262.1 hypothetical protein [Cyclobacteriaceae bacterium]MDW8331281.1 hypothetical protein [Cyclobacteriaceae bacterium]
MKLNHETNALFTADKRLLFLLLCLCSFVLLFARQSFIESQTAAFEFLQDRPEGFVLRLVQGLQWLGVPIIYLWKLTVIAFLLWVGCFTFGYRVTYSQCWSVALGAEFVFLIPDLIKVLWFFFFVPDPGYAEIGSFYPLSLLSFFDYHEIDRKWAYPLRALNAFEIFYWFILTKGLRLYTRQSLSATWRVTAFFYVSIFLAWLAFYVVVYK